MAKTGVVSSGKPDYSGFEGQEANLSLDEQGQLRVVAAVTVTPPGTAEIDIQSVGGNPVTTSVPVSVAALPLPAGAATSAGQTAGNASLASIDGKTPAKGAATTANSTPVNIASDQTVAVSAASWPLPGGAATAANQTSVQSAAGTASATVISVQGNAAGVAVPVSAAALPLPIGAATAANQATGNAALSSIDTKTPAKGAATTANSSPVNIASDQVVPVSAVALPLPAGAATAANQTCVQSAPGTPQTVAVTVQGNASGVPLPASVNGVNGAGAATLSNPLPVFEPDGGSTAAPIAANGSGTQTSAAVLFSLDTSGYNGISIQVTSPGTGCTITYEQSNDNSTWQTTLLQSATSVSLVPTSASSTANVLQGNLGARYFRARVSTYTSGSITAFYALRRGAIINNASLVPLLGPNGTSVVSTANALPVELIAAAVGAYSYSNITAAATTTVKSGPGTLHTLNINTGAASATVTVYDSTTGSGAKVGTFQAATAASYLVDAAFGNGLTLVTSGSADVSVTWK